MGGSGTKKDAFKNYGVGQNLSNQLTSNASNIYGSLEPTFQAEAAHPSGFNPNQKALMNTASQQSAGGQAAGAVGSGRLYAARTNNAGGAKAAVGEGVREAGGNLSKAALGTELADASLAQQNQQRGISGLQGLYGTTLGEGENALGLSNQALGIANQAKPTFWQQMATTAGKNLVNAGTDAAEGFAGF
jgi:hypothetical protein